jgi:hypothetical protein
MALLLTGKNINNYYRVCGYRTSGAVEKKRLATVDGRQSLSIYKIPILNTATFNSNITHHTIEKSVQYESFIAKI